MTGPENLVLYLWRHAGGGYRAKFRGRWPRPYPGVSQLDAPAFHGATQGKTFEECFDHAIEALTAFFDEQA